MSLYLKGLFLALKLIDLLCTYGPEIDELLLSFFEKAFEKCSPKTYSR